MKEVSPMWDMCRLLAKHRHEWVPMRAEARAYDANKEMIEKFAGTPNFDVVMTQETYLEMIHGTEAYGDLKVESNSLIVSYITAYMWGGKSKTINISTDKIHMAELSKAKTILRLCVNHKPSFIKQEGSLVWLSAEGESFAADWFGLFKQYLIEMGIVWTAISALIIGLLPFLIPLLITWIHTW